MLGYFLCKSSIRQIWLFKSIKRHNIIFEHLQMQKHKNSLKKLHEVMGMLT